MSRRRRAEKKPTCPDSRYGDAVIGKFINNLMWKGKKNIAACIVYDALEGISSKIGKEPADVFHTALGHVKPAVEVRSRRVGGATYTIPVPVSPRRSQALAIRWLIHAARGRPEKTMVERLAGELKNAMDDTGIAVKKKTDTHRMAEANKAFSHYRV
jgi:small subunit ribosomal protein S7